MAVQGNDRPVKIIILEKTGEPIQFKLEGQTRFCTGERTVVDGDIVYINYPFMDKDLGVVEHPAPGVWKYWDLSEETDTFVNGEMVKTGYEHELSDGDVIKISNDKITLVCVFIDHYNEDVEWRTISLADQKEAVYIYGQRALERDKDNNEIINPAAHNAVLTFEGDRWEVSDVNTERGVYVNKVKVEGTHPLQMYDVICIGDTLFIYQEKRLIFNYKSADKNKLHINIEERTVWNFFKRKTLLKDIRLTVDPGDMVLILGGSGAGKTTFINAVTGYEKAKATIVEGGRDIYKDYNVMKYEIGMVPQQDLLRGDDNVRMTLMNAADMRLPVNMPDADKKKKVDDVLLMFGLDGVSGELVEKLSGGQRKRLSIAVEFMADPSLFILDEPDSGLDGVMARDLMERLRKIADQNRIVMVITHTPDRVVDLFDKVIVLAKDSSKTGRLCFYGSIADARAFFGCSKMEEIVLRINGTSEGGEGRADEFIAKYEKRVKDEA